MGRLIDADALIDARVECPEHISFFEFGEMVERFLQTIDEQPTVDAVPVSYIYKRAMELKNEDMMYAYTVLNSLIANYRADGERKGRAG